MRRIVPLLLLLTLVCTACGKQAVPEDFSFAMTWNCYGVSSYDSATGVLVKTTDATHPEDYVTEYHLTEAERQQIRKLLQDLDADSYPDEYDPNPEVKSDPSMTLILTVRTGAGEKTIRAEGIALGYPAAPTAAGRRFLETCRTIETLLTGTEAWQALPDYEFLYE